MERFVNILILSENRDILKTMKQTLRGKGNNVLIFSDQAKAFTAARGREIGIYLIDFDKFKILKELLEDNLSVQAFKKRFIIPLFTRAHTDETISKTLQEGAVDYIRFPMSPELIRNKLDVHKAVYYKDKRINQLLQNIFPLNVLQEVSQVGRFSPKKVDKGVVLFTDFVDFSSHSKQLRPLELIQKLEHYFSEFDRIVEKYQVEKIKTIGDAYMAIAGVSEDAPHPAIRSVLAALEIQHFVASERKKGEKYWDVRIGIHMGALVAGIIGTKRFSFDVWGDTVNIASRTEEAAQPGTISITSRINDTIIDYFETVHLGKMDIRKRGGSVEIFQLKGLKKQFSHHENNIIPSSELREKCGLTPMDFDEMRTQILKQMEERLPDNLSYHDIHHTLDVEKSAMRYAELEGVTGMNLLLLRTAVLYHDAGFIYSYRNNEDFAMNLVQKELPCFGYSQEEIAVIKGIINATKHSVNPETLLQQIMCDSDHDYLGRADYYHIANELRMELAEMDTVFTESEWVKFQLDFLEGKHRYFTISAQNIRKTGKKERIKELKKKLNK